MTGPARVALAGTLVFVGALSLGARPSPTAEDLAFERLERPMRVCVLTQGLAGRDLRVALVRFPSGEIVAGVTAAKGEPPLPAEARSLFQTCFAAAASALFETLGVPASGRERVRTWSVNVPAARPRGNERESPGPLQDASVAREGETCGGAGEPTLASPRTCAEGLRCCPAGGRADAPSRCIAVVTCPPYP